MEQDNLEVCGLGILGEPRILRLGILRKLCIVRCDLLPLA